MNKRPGVNPRERKPNKFRDGGRDDSSPGYKNIALLCLIVFPSLVWLISVGTDVISEIGSVFGNYCKAIFVCALLLLPLVLAYFVKQFRGLFRILVPVLLAVLLFPTVHVYFCSPVEIRNEVIGTKFSLQTTASGFLQQSCEEQCLQNSKLAFGFSYSLTLFTPRVSLRTKFDQIVDLNITTSAMVGGEKLDVAKLVLLKSWRSVKGKYFALHIITRVPVKIKKFQEGLKDKKGMAFSGRVDNIPGDLKSLRSQLERQKLFVRPFVLEVYHVKLIEE